MKSDDEEDKASDEEKGSDSDGSQDSGFGFDKKKVKGKKPLAPTKRFNKKAPQTTQTGGEAGQTAASGQAAATPESAEKEVDLTAPSISSKGGAQSADQVSSKATTLLNSLRQVSPLALWQTPTKARDLDAKVSRAMNCLSRLEAFPDNKACEDVAKELKPVTDRLSKFIDILNRFKLRDGPLSANSFLKNLEVCREELIAACEFLSPECVKAVLIDLGKDSAEARIFILFRFFGAILAVLPFPLCDIICSRRF